MKAIKFTCLAAFLATGSASASVTEVSKIQSIACGLNKSHCLVHLEKPVYSEGKCTGSAVSVPVESKQTLSVLTSAMFTNTSVQIYLSPECVLDSHELQTINLIK